MADPRPDQDIDKRTLTAPSEGHPRSRIWAMFLFCLLMAVVSVVALVTEQARFDNHHDWRNLEAAFGFTWLSLEQWLSLHPNETKKDNKALRLLYSVLLGPTIVIFLGFVVYYLVLALAWVSRHL
jgi:hypothetical protein